LTEQLETRAPAVDRVLVFDPDPGTATRIAGAIGALGGVEPVTSSSAVEALETARGAGSRSCSST